MSESNTKIFEGRRILVLGAGGGIGGQVGKLLEQKGAEVVGGGRSQSGAIDFTCDASDPEGFEATLEKLFSEQEIHGAVNCIGSLWLKPAHMTPLEVWQQTMNVNLTSSFLLVKHFAKNMPKDGGSVVLMSSAAGRIGLANHEAIGAAKAGIQGLMLSAAATYGGRGFRINTVAPGLTETPLTKGLLNNEMTLKASERMHALGRVGQASEVASAVVWLLAPSNSWVTGQTLGVDGGLGTVRSRG